MGVSLWSLVGLSEALQHLCRLGVAQIGRLLVPFRRRRRVQSGCPWHRSRPEMTDRRFSRVELPLLHRRFQRPGYRAVEQKRCRRWRASHPPVEAAPPQFRAAEKRSVERCRCLREWAKDRANAARRLLGQPRKSSPAKLERSGPVDVRQVLPGPVVVRRRWPAMVTQSSVALRPEAVRLTVAPPHRLAQSFGLQPQRLSGALPQTGVVGPTVALPRRLARSLGLQPQRPSVGLPRTGVVRPAVAPPRRLARLFGLQPQRPSVALPRTEVARPIAAPARRLARSLVVQPLRPRSQGPPPKQPAIAPTEHWYRLGAAKQQRMRQPRNRLGDRAVAMQQQPSLRLWKADERAAGWPRLPAANAAAGLLGRQLPPSVMNLGMARAHPPLPNHPRPAPARNSCPGQRSSP